ncbi:hypothetical protein BHO_0116900 (plasmid) [Borrelia hermsii YBT]|uniref:Variable large protein n=1 Tax=Borrelia hermsii YBT TaxID=1313295 RepID=W5T328_BORHE|nr:hypothetical protein BHO_0116900 [Borrelia hermsii YBT]
MFTSFGDIVSKVLGFSTETKKSDVGAYFRQYKVLYKELRTSLIKLLLT